jgi:MoaA/NifB/PqqE/SkfB family radical SAM enzyme
MMRCHFDEDFKNGIAGWYFPKELIKEAYRRSGMLMLDMEFGETCSLNCDYCFRTDDIRERISRARPNSRALTSSDVINIVDQAEEMGTVKSIHFVGKGECLEQEGFLEIVHHINEKEMIPLIFTAGHVLGDDTLARDKQHGMTGTEIVNDLYESNASIILKINSVNERVQNEVVRRDSFPNKDGTERKFNYTRSRDEALERLIHRGFNKLEHNPTRLGTASVILKSNYSELFHHYRYFRSLNIYPIINTVVPCGRTRDMTKVKELSPSPEEKIELWKKIYSYNVENGIKYEGISSYVGGHVCSQLGYGMYINVFGEAFDCPSSTRKSIGNVKFNGNDGHKISELWNQAHYKKICHGCLDNGCPWRFLYSPAMIPRRLFKEVHEYLKDKYPTDENVKNFVPDAFMRQHYD